MIRYRAFFVLTLMVLAVAAGSAVGQNNPPVLTPIADTTITEGDPLILVIEATDLDGNAGLQIWAVGVPANANFLDGGNGNAGFNFNPDLNQAGFYPVIFYASDGIDTVSMTVGITVLNFNQAPVLDTILPQSVLQGETLTFPVTASDPDGTIPVLSVVPSTLPANASLIDNHDGTGTFSFTPDSSQVTTFGVRFIAADTALADTMTVPITVSWPPNRQPVFVPIPPQQVAEGARLELTIVASDPDGTIDTLESRNLPANANFTDNRNNTGTFVFTPPVGQAGSFTVTFIVSDSSAVQPVFLADTMDVPIEVTANTGPPVLDSIGPKEVIEGQVLEFTIHAVDPDGAPPQLWYDSLALPRGTGEVQFTDSANGTGVFRFEPKFWRQGSYLVTFFAGDGANTVSEAVPITVLDAGNQPPVIDPVGPKSVIEGSTVSFTVTAHDPDDSTAALMPVQMDTASIPPNVSFVDSTRAFTFTPDCRQGNTVYDFAFFASDGALADTEIVPITVVDTGNWLPTLAVGSEPTTAKEGRRVAITLYAADCEGDINDFWLTPSPDSEIFKGNVRLTVTGGGSALFEFAPDYTQSGSYLFGVHASDGEDTVSKQISVTILDVAKNANDLGEADTLRLARQTWDGVGSLAVPCTIYNDSTVTGAITGFRWFDTSFVCDSIVLGPILDNAFYKTTRIFPDSLYFEAEFIFYDSQRVQPPGGLYFTVYFTNNGTWGSGSVFIIDTVKIGNNGDFVFDNKLKGPPPKAVAGEDVNVADFLSASTYPPLFFIGEVRAPLGVDDGPPAIPDQVELGQNFPNPFNPETTIRFSLARRGQVSIVVYNILGQKIATLTDREYEPGEHRVVWDGRDGSGRQAASGIYLYQIRSEQLTKARKMVLLR